MDDANNPAFSDTRTAGCAALLPPYGLGWHANGGIRCASPALL